MGQRAALEIAAKRKGRWFDPEVVRVFQAIGRKKQLWAELENAAERLPELEPQDQRLAADDSTIENICAAFSDVIDAKSPFTYRHSTGVAATSVSIARTLGLGEPEVKLIRRAALLHDIGKLGISNAILEKPDTLSSEDWQAIYAHPQVSAMILQRVPGLDNSASWWLATTRSSTEADIFDTCAHRSFRSPRAFSLLPRFSMRC